MTALGTARRAFTDAWLGVRSLSDSHPASSHKACVEGGAHVSKVIHDVSRGSKFYENQRQRHGATTARIERMMARRAALSQADHARAAEHVARLAADLEAQRDLSRLILHCDLDMFYAAVELQREPALAGKCFAVGGRGVLLTASYEARRVGVRSGMAAFVARAICPDLLVVDAHFDAYQRSSAAVMQVLRSYDPTFLQRSLDEAYLDVTAYCETHRASADDVARELRARVVAATGLTVSVGIAPNILLAKIASDRAKPNGQLRVPSDRTAILAFIAPLEVRSVPGIGVVTERMLTAVRAATCAAIWERRVELSLCMDQFPLLLAAALGIGATRVAPPRREERRSIGRESTFAPTSDPAAQHAHLRAACEKLERDMAALEFRARTVSLVGKHDTFERFTRTKTVPGGAASFDELYAATFALLAAVRAAFPAPLRLRLIGVRASSLIDVRSAHHGALAQWLRRSVHRAATPDPTCPICSETIAGGGGRLGHAVVNAHIDRCLEARTLPPRKRHCRTRTLDEYFRQPT